jgi:type III secretion protein L
VEAGERAVQIVRDAEVRARAIVDEARTQGEREAREAEHAKLSAAYLALKGAEEQRAERDLERVMALAVVLAERLIGAEIARDPAVVASLARRALEEARGARRAILEHSPLDEAALVRDVVAALPEGTIELRPNPDFSRGSLVVHTDLGTLNAKLTPQLERLADALRDLLLRPA